MMEVIKDLDIYVCCVDQAYANNWSIEAAFTTEEAAEKYKKQHYVSCDVVVEKIKLNPNYD